MARLRYNNKRRGNCRSNEIEIDRPILRKKLCSQEKKSKKENSNRKYIKDKHKEKPTKNGLFLIAEKRELKQKVHHIFLTASKIIKPSMLVRHQGLYW